MQDAIAVELARQSRQAELDRAVADVETVRDAALPQPAELEAQPQRELDQVQGQVETPPVRGAAEDAPFHREPGLEPGRRIAVQVRGGVIHRQIDRARNDFRQRRSSQVRGSRPGNPETSKGRRLFPARARPDRRGPESLFTVKQRVQKGQVRYGRRTAFRSERLRPASAPGDTRCPRTSTRVGWRAQTRRTSGRGPAPARLRPPDR